MNKTKLAELKAAGEKATQGEWKDGLCGDVLLPSKKDPNSGFMICDTHECENEHNNAAYIAAANPTTILSLLSEIESLKEQVEITRKQGWSDCLKLIISKDANKFECSMYSMGELRDYIESQLHKIEAQLEEMKDE